MLSRDSCKIGARYSSDKNHQPDLAAAQIEFTSLAIGEILHFDKIGTYAISYLKFSSIFDKRDAYVWYVRDSES